MAVCTAGWALEEVEEAEVVQALLEVMGRCR